MQKTDEKTEKVVELFRPYEDFSRCLIDAYVVINADGKPVLFNTLFCQLTGHKSKKISRTEDVSELLEFRVDDQYLSFNDLMNFPAPTRIDEVQAKTSRGEHNLIVGVYPLRGKNAEKNEGCFLLIRDVTAETLLQGKYKNAAAQSVTDSLTGLFTRAYFEDYLSLQTRTLKEAPLDAGDRDLALVMIDIDHFKQVNDTYGHQAGDHILKIMASVIRKSFRKSDVCCRYGGEEFLVILPGTDLDGSFRAAEKLRQNVEDEQILFDGTRISITISAGISKVKIGAETYEQALSRADKALYKAKEQGRNRVKIAA